MTRPIVAEPLNIEKGMAIVQDAVGSGMEWVENEVRRFAARHFIWHWDNERRWHKNISNGIPFKLTDALDISSNGMK